MRLTAADLQHLTTLVLRQMEDVFSRAPVAGLYRDRLIALALCQGAAAHFIDGTTGIKDLDVWAFFSDGPAKPFPWRGIWHVDCGPSHLGRHPDDVGYRGRRIDIIGRSIPVPLGQAPENAIRAWVKRGSASAQHLAKRPMIGLFPNNLYEQCIWLPDMI